VTKSRFFYQNGKNLTNKISELPWPEMKKPTADILSMYGIISDGALVPR